MKTKYKNLSIPFFWLSMPLIILIWGLFLVYFHVLRSCGCLRSDLRVTHLCLNIIFLCNQTPNESFKRGTVLIPVSPDAPSQTFTANNAVTNHFSLMPYTCLAPLANHLQLNSWHVYFCSDTHPDAFQLQSHLKTMTEKRNPSFSPLNWEGG